MRTKRLTVGDPKDDRSYAYDALRRLVAVSDRGTKPLGFAYDPVGNRTATLRDGKLAEQASFDAADQLTTLHRRERAARGQLRVRPQRQLGRAPLEQ